MFEEEDRETGYAVFLAVTVAIVVSAFALALAIGAAIGQSGGGASAQAEAESAPAPSIVRVVGRVFFEADTVEPPSDVTMLLRPALRLAHVMPASKLIVAGYYDAGGDAAAGADLARRRAASVRDALVASGVGAQRIELAGPLGMAGGGDGRDARSVEVTLR